MNDSVPPHVQLAAHERRDRDWALQVADIVRADTGRPGRIVASSNRIDDILATLHGAGVAATADAGRTGVVVGAGAPTWLVHADGPASLDAYIDDLAALPDVTRATLLSAPADYARHRADAGDDTVALARIDAMQGYAEWPGCRHQALAGRRGHEHPGACGHCDNCAAPPAGLVGAEDARQVIEAVRQTGERFGAKHIVSVLRGERTPTVEGHGHDRLSVWGHGREVTRAQWDAVLRQLLAAGVIAVNTDGGLVTTPLSEPVRAGERTIRFARHLTLPDAPMPKRRGVAATKPATSGPRRTSSGGPARTASGSTRAPSARATEDAKRALYRWRTAYAAELGVPAIRILTDPDISRLIVRRPRGMEELRLIITPSRCDAYGEAILGALADL